MTLHCFHSCSFCIYFPLLSTVCEGTPWEGSCYRLFNQTKGQALAQQACADLHGGHLVYIDSTEEFVFIKRLVGEERYWVGLRSVFAWMDGGEANYRAFRSAFASHNDMNRCFVLVSLPTADVWMDEACSNIQTSYICERELGPATEDGTPSQGRCTETAPA